MSFEPTPETPTLLDLKYEYVPDDMTKIVAETYKGMQFYNAQVAITISILFIFMLADTGIALVAMLLNDGSITISSPNMIVRWIIGMAIIIISALVLKLVAKHATKKVYSTPGKSGLFCEHTITLNDRGFVETTEVNGSFHAWEGVDSIRDTENYLTIYVRLGAGYSIPKRVFANEQALKEFTDTAQNLFVKANQVSREVP